MPAPECDRALAELEEYLHHELSRVDAVTIAEHMEECIDCADEYRVRVVLTEVIKRSCRDTAPAHLREQVLVQLRLIASH